MKQFLIDSDGQNNNYVALGGIGSGFLKLFGDGKMSLQNIRAGQKNSNLAGLSFFAIKASDNNTVRDVRILVSGNDDSGNNLLLTYPHFEKSGMTVSFPFVTKSFESENFPAKVNLCAFNPFAPLNDTDSSIPASFFEFTVKNTAATEMNFSLCSVCENVFESSKNTMGCNQDGSFFVRMTDDTSGYAEQNCSVCVATDFKDVSFQEYFTSNPKENVLETFWNEFVLCETFENKGIDDAQENNGALICSHFSLKPEQEIKIKFVISWFFPMADEIQKCYYSQYFGSSDECAGYCFDHWERLKNDTLRFSKTLFDSTLPDIVLNQINNSLCSLEKSNLVRYQNGGFGKDSAFCLELLSPIISLFPKLTRTVLSENMTQILSSDELCHVSTKQKLLTIIYYYKLYMADGDYEQLIENWYNVSKLADDIYTVGGIKDKDEHLITTFVALRACVTMARDVKDKKRLLICEKLLFRLNLEIEEQKFYNQAPGFYYAFECGFLDIFEKVKSSTSLLVSQDNKHKISFVYLARHFLDKANALLKESENADVSALSQIEAYFLLNACSGFVYNRKDSHVNVNPIDDFTEDGVFKCFFCVETGLGYIERGVDYIEINMVYGTIDVRKISVPKRGRMVLYGQRKWRFDSLDNNSTVVLDSVLAVSSDKKLTVIIDV